jgi:hypothetical protein
LLITWDAVRTLVGFKILRRYLEVLLEGVRSFQNSIDCPSRMLGDERFSVKGRSSERWQISAVPHISESDADISQKPPALDPFDRRATENGAELGIIECQIVTQGHLCSWARRECRFSRDQGEAVPRTRIKAIIATINAIANERPQLKRDRAF